MQQKYTTTTREPGIPKLKKAGGTLVKSQAMQR